MGISLSDEADELEGERKANSKSFRYARCPDSRVSEKIYNASTDNRNETVEEEERRQCTSHFSIAILNLRRYYNCIIFLLKIIC